jgi:hypothetical protein
MVDSMDWRRVASSAETSAAWWVGWMVALKDGQMAVSMAE